MCNIQLYLLAFVGPVSAIGSIRLGVRSFYIRVQKFIYNLSVIGERISTEYWLTTKVVLGIFTVHVKQEIE